MMKSVALVCAAAVLWASPVSAFNRPKKEPEAKVRSCPELGEGYVRLPGLDTCVRIDGLVRVEGVVIRGSH